MTLSLLTPDGEHLSLRDLCPGVSRADGQGFKLDLKGDRDKTGPSGAKLWDCMTILEELHDNEALRSWLQ